MYPSIPKLAMGRINHKDKIESIDFFSTVFGEYLFLILNNLLTMIKLIEKANMVPNKPTSATNLIGQDKKDPPKDAP